MLCAAPTVLIGIANAPGDARERCARGVRVLTAGAPPAAATIERIEGELGWEITQVYGLTETAPFITICEPLPGTRALSPARARAVKARQGVELMTSGELRVVDEHGREVPRDGETLGEIVARGNVVMKGYYNDPEATDAGVRAAAGSTPAMPPSCIPDGYVEIRDRFKDVIISGGENISSIEVEGAAAASSGRARSGGRRHAAREVGRGAARVRRAAARCEPQRPRSCVRSAAITSPTSRCPRCTASWRSCRKRRPARSRSTCCANSAVRSAGSRRNSSSNPGRGPMGDTLFYLAAIPAVILMGLAKGGFAGIGAFAMPLLALAISPVQAAAILLPLLILQDAVGIWAFRKEWDGGILLLMVPSAAVGIVLGYLLAAKVSVNAVLAALGVISIAFAALRLWSARGGRVAAPRDAPAILGALLGVAAGFTSQVAHAGTPPFQMWVLPKGLPPPVLIGTTAIFFGVINWLKVPAYLLSDNSRTKI